MPWKLVPPHTRKDGKKIDFYYVRGKVPRIRLTTALELLARRRPKRIFGTWKAGRTW